ncbi:Alpha-glucosidase [Dendrobium catenatum]|uniref:Alpha-glucosidase n=1 Tax=Dendrobium catenatum TaxID=906689 RepID=A0A2I0V9N4_9ASPA|nr:Alpha-glucosidase [Dendrobium catenatum]
MISLFSLLGEVWPGPCVFPDFTRKEARLWWANLVKDFVSNGVDGIWNDMNEPAVFKVSLWKLRPAVSIRFSKIDKRLQFYSTDSYKDNA